MGNNSGHAIAAFILGIVGLLLFPLAVAAVIFGVIALNKIKSDSSLGGKGLAIAGIVLGVIGILIGILILPFLIIIGSLAFFGVLSPDSMLPEQCSLPFQLACMDFKVTESSITIEVQNNFGRDMQLKKVEFLSPSIDGSCIKDFSSSPLTLSKYDRLSITTDNCVIQKTGRAKEKFDIIIQYNWVNSSTIHSFNGKLVSKIERI